MDLRSLGSADALVLAAPLPARLRHGRRLGPAAEQALGVRFEGGYRQFLRQFGWGGVEHIELHGLGPGVPSHLDLVRLTHSERTEMEPQLQRHLIPVMNDGGGNLYCLDTSTAGEPKIVFWDHTLGGDQVPKIEAEDFACWLGSLLGDLQ